MNQYLTREEVRRRKTKRISLWVGSMALVVLSVWCVVALNKASQGSVLGEQVSSTDRTFGNPQGIVELVEYSDFQCPACAAASPKVSQLMVDYKDQIKFVYRHFPLKQIHPNAEPAAKAAEAAGVQGKFMEMADALFKNQDRWKNSPNPTGLFTDYAKELGLDTDKFQKDMRSADIETKIERDYQSGVQTGVNSTPTFFLNGKKIATPATYEGFAQLIQEAINEKQ
jgi:protein-disulfide isomerase